jgi:hypothetical protein
LQIKWDLKKLFHSVMANLNKWAITKEEYSYRFKILTTVVMNVAIIKDIAPCSPYINRRFGGTYHLHHQGKKSAEQESTV